MDNLFFIIVLISFLALIIGVFKPSAVVRWGDVEKRNRKNVFKYYGLSLIASFILFTISIPTVETEESLKSEVQAEETSNLGTEQTEEVIAREESEPEPVTQNYKTGISRDEMARDKDGLKGSLVTFSGEIIQVMEEKKYTHYRMAIDGDYDQIILIEITNDKLSSNILENDYITIEGESVGNTSYETVLGSELIVPAVSVDSFYTQTN